MSSNLTAKASLQLCLRNAMKKADQPPGTPARWNWAPNWSYLFRNNISGLWGIRQL